MTTASWMSCSSRRSAPMRGPGVDGADAAGMAGAPGLEEVERLSAAHLADRYAVGPQAQRTSGPDRTSVATPSLVRIATRLGAAHCSSRVSSIEDDAIGGLRDLGEQRVGERGLAGRGAAGNEDIAPIGNDRARSARPGRAVMMPAAT